MSTRIATCYDIAMMIADEETQKCFGNYVEDTGKKLDFKECCEMIDWIIDRENCESSEITVNEDNRKISITIFGQNFKIEEFDEEFDVMRIYYGADISDSQTKSGGTRVVFTFDGFWKQAD